VSASWERVRALFHAALEQPADARSAFLTTACEGDEALRREVESLLGAHRAADQFLESPAIGLGPDHAVAAPAALQSGDRIGNFEVIGSLGAGGMGEVYRARDERLRREVAIKLLPRALADDPQRLARFERESRMLAALNHPHIATIHCVEHAEGLHALVMELVEGPTLADRLARGALGWRETLGFARDLASALEASHDKGVVHRDLKPANIKFSSTGSLKLLDFGLAKERTEPEPAGDTSATRSADALKTADGWVVGTSAYMSPEQTRGLPVDKRTDIWAFGCVLFEMLTGTRAFPGRTIPDTAEAVLERQPDWTSLPTTTPDTMRRLLQRCLEKIGSAGSMTSPTRGSKSRTCCRRGRRSPAPPDRAEQATGSSDWRRWWRSPPGRPRSDGGCARSSSPIVPRFGSREAPGFSRPARR
jgi:serine/threonine protein kinase